MVTGEEKKEVQEVNQENNIAGPNSNPALRLRYSSRGLLRNEHTKGISMKKGKEDRANYRDNEQKRVKYKHEAIPKRSPMRINEKRKEGEREKERKVEVQEAIAESFSTQRVVLEVESREMVVVNITSSQCT